MKNKAKLVSTVLAVIALALSITAITVIHHHYNQTTAMIETYYRDSLHNRLNDFLYTVMALQQQGLLTHQDLVGTHKYFDPANDAFWHGNLEEADLYLTQAEAVLATLPK